MNSAVADKTGCGSWANSSVTDNYIVQDTLILWAKYRMHLYFLLYCISLASTPVHSCIFFIGSIVLFAEQLPLDPKLHSETCEM